MSQQPTKQQTQALLELLANAMLELRLLGWGGDAQQAGDLANALHNLPISLYDVDYDWTTIHASLTAYEQRYSGKTMFKYATQCTRIIDNPNTIVSFQDVTQD